MLKNFNSLLKENLKSLRINSCLFKQFAKINKNPIVKENNTQSLTPYEIDVLSFDLPEPERKHPEKFVVDSVDPNTNKKIVIKDKTMKTNRLTYGNPTNRKLNRSMSWDNKVNIRSKSPVHSFDANRLNESIFSEEWADKDLDENPIPDPEIDFHNYENRDHVYPSKQIEKTPHIKRDTEPIPVEGGKVIKRFEPLQINDSNNIKNESETYPNSDETSGSSLYVTEIKPRYIITIARNLKGRKKNNRRSDNVRMDKGSSNPNIQHPYFTENKIKDTQHKIENKSIARANVEKAIRKVKKDSRYL